MLPEHGYLRIFLKDGRVGVLLLNRHVFPYWGENTGISDLPMRLSAFPSSGFFRVQVHAGFVCLLPGVTDLRASVSILLSVLRKEVQGVFPDGSVYQGGIQEKAQAVLLPGGYCN